MTSSPPPRASIAPSIDRAEIERSLHLMGSDSPPLGIHLPSAQANINSSSEIIQSDADNLVSPPSPTYRPLHTNNETTTQLKDVDTVSASTDVGILGAATPGDLLNRDNTENCTENSKATDDNDVVGSEGMTGYSESIPAQVNASNGGGKSLRSDSVEKGVFIATRVPSSDLSSQPQGDSSSSGRDSSLGGSGYSHNILGQSHLPESHPLRTYGTMSEPDPNTTIATEANMQQSVGSTLQTTNQHADSNEDNDPYMQTTSHLTDGLDMHVEGGPSSDAESSSTSDSDHEETVMVDVQSDSETPNVGEGAPTTEELSSAELLALAKKEQQLARRREKQRQYREKRRARIAQEKRDAEAREQQRKANRAAAQRRRQERLAAEKRAQKEVFCFCQKPYDEKFFMIACDSCDEWFHSKCINTTDRALRNVDAFYCPQCLENNRYLFIRYSKEPHDNIADDDVEVDIATTVDGSEIANVLKEVVTTTATDTKQAQEPSPGPVAAEEKSCLYHKCERSAGPRTKYCSHQCALLTNALRIRAMIRLAKGSHVANIGTRKAPHSRQSQRVRLDNPTSNHPNSDKSIHLPPRLLGETPETSHRFVRSHPYVRKPMPLCEKRSLEHRQRMATITAERCRIKRCIEAYKQLEIILSQIIEEGKLSQSDTADDTAEATQSGIASNRAKVVEDPRQDIHTHKVRTATSLSAEDTTSVPLEDSVMCNMCGATMKANMLTRHLFSCFTKNEALQVPQALYNAFPYTHMSESFCQHNGKSSEQIRCHHLRNTCPLHSKHKIKVKGISGRKAANNCSFPLGLDVDSLLEDLSNGKAVSTTHTRCAEKKDKCLLHAYWEWRLRTKIERERFVLEAKELLTRDEERREKINQGSSHNIYNSLFFKAIDETEKAQKSSIGTIGSEINSK